ncbi:serine/threonine protein kinase [Methylococcaceae bacterium WWC4]|uniref:serine/threonine protein kinase n=1 Tax=Methylomonas sp. LWB TaxID=1905845 RepID=UPI0008D96E5A|nr:serine/threonine-protein kinase [Methylomonas sp. LWB]NJA04587.1 serine/threonine protein kinase [Methylococcaceae bacterium WWC4]OHX35777.1 serine/threonine protein kinase [Methylomonas sp. LWB]
MAEYYDPETYPKQWNYLQSGTIIDQYMIERELAHGGFSSVYLARQMADQVQVAIKEYLPRKLAHRTWNNVVVPNSDEAKALFMRGRALFFEEAKVLAMLKHHNIVDVINFFQANDTVYMVMAYDYGVTLDKILHKRMLPITEEFLLTVFRQLLTGIEVVHQKGLVHLDIKPANILIRSGNDPLLLDFGAIRKISLSPQRSRAKVLTNGYSPIEQYDSQGNLGPWSDLYAVGASMRACLDCRIPMSSPDRVKQDDLPPAVKAFKRRYPEYLLKAIDWAMAVFPEHRPQSVAQMQAALSPAG